MELEFGGRRYAVAAGDFVIGNGPGAALFIDAGGVRPRHVVVRLGGPGRVVVAPGETGAEILVNGVRLGSDPTPLMHGDKLGVGGAEITVSDPGRAGATRVLGTSTSPAPAARLVSLTDGREYALDASPFLIGRDAGARIVVESDLVSRRHAEILATPDGHSLVDLSSNGVLVNGRRITAPVVLRGDDVIKVGPAEYRYHSAETSQAPAAGADYRLGNTVVGLQAIRRPPPMPTPPPQAPAEPLAMLLVKKGKRKGERLPVQTPVANIGRGEYNDVALPDASISADHAKLKLKEGVWVLTDLGSTNGSRVDGQPVRGDLALSPGAEIALGEVLLLFEPRDKGITPVSPTRELSSRGAGGPVAISPTLVIVGGVALAALVAFLVFG